MGTNKPLFHDKTSFKQLSLIFEEQWENLCYVYLAFSLDG